MEVIRGINDFGRSYVTNYQERIYDDADVLCGEEDNYPDVTNIIQYLETKCDNSELRNGVIYKHKFIHYKSLLLQVNLAAQKLFCSTKNLESKQQIVGIRMKEGFERLVAILACIKIGLVIVPLDVSFSNSELFQRATLAEVNFIIHEDSSDAMCDAFWRFISFKSLLCPCDMSVVHSNNTSIEYRYKEHDCVVRLFTSGSCGQPKLIWISHSQLRNRLNWQWKNLPYGKQEIVCHRTNFMFVDNIVESLSCMLSTVNMVIVPPLDGSNIYDLATVVRDFRISWILCVPSLLQKWIEQLRDSTELIQNFQSLTTIVCSGEILRTELAQATIEALGALRIVNLYGSTEVCGDVSCEIYESLADVERLSKSGFLSIGVPVANNNILVKTSDDSCIGELVVQGKNVSPSCDNYFSTGDIGFIHKNRIYVTGRIDDMIKINGKKLFITSINREIMKFDFVLDCYTVHHNITNRNFLVCFYTLHEDCENHIFRAEIISKFPFKTYSGISVLFQKIDSIPQQQQSYKPDKALLRNEAKTIIMRDVIHVSILEPKKSILSGNQLHSFDKKKFGCRKLIVIHQIFSKYLYIDEDVLSDDMDFYQLGGDSMIAVMCVSELNKSGIKCSLSQMFESGRYGSCTIGDLKRTLLSNSIINNRDDVDNLSEYQVHKIQQHHKTEVMDFFMSHFASKELVVNYLQLSDTAVLNVVEDIFTGCMCSELSFCVRNRVDQRIMGLCLLQEVLQEESSNNSSSVSDEYEEEVDHLSRFLASCKADVKMDPVEPRADVVVVAVHSGIRTALVCHILYFIEQHARECARRRGFRSIETVNTSEVTKNICLELGYQLLKQNSLVEYLTFNAPQYLSPETPDVPAFYMSLDLS